MLPHYENDYLLPHVIHHNARLYADSCAVVCGAERLSWRELDIATNKAANALIARGLKKGGKVAILSPNAITSFVTFWAVLKAGGVIVPLNGMLDESSLARLADSSDGSFFFAAAAYADLVDAVRDKLPKIAADHFFIFGADRAGWQSGEAFFASGADHAPGVVLAPADGMTIFYSSGTTGTPKGIAHSHFGRLNYAYGFGAAFGINRHSVAICATPIYASGTCITMLPTLYCGGKIVLLSKFAPEAFLSAVEAEGGTHSFMVPAMYVSVLEHTLSSERSGREYDCSSWRVLISAGQTMAQATRDALGARFPHAGIHEVYGMTEGFFTIALPDDFALGKRDTVGKAGFLEDIRIIGEDDRELPNGEVGEIVAYGPGMMQGYYARPDLTEETVWCSPAGRTYLRSGDLGYLDADGYLYVSGRKKDMIKSGGINIYAIDIEDVMMTHPAVSEAAAIGIPHPRWSETPIGVVTLKPGAAITESELLAWINERLAKYQRLTQLAIVEDFPRATYGKIQKDRLRAIYSAEA